MSSVEVVSQLAGDKLAAQAVAAGFALEVPLADLIDVDAEKARLTKELEKVRREIDGLERTLPMPALSIARRRKLSKRTDKRLADYQEQAAKLTEAFERLNNGRPIDFRLRSEVLAARYSAKTSGPGDITSRAIGP